MLPVLPKTSTVSLEVLNVENLKYVSAVGASLSGLSGLFFLEAGFLHRAQGRARRQPGWKSKITEMQVFGLRQCRHRSHADTYRFR